MDRIDRLMKLARETGLTVDYLEFLSRGLDRSAEAILFGNISTLPQYMKSSDNPYVWRNNNAPFNDTR